MSESKAVATSAPRQITSTERLGSLLEKADVKKRFDAMLGQRSAGFVSSILSLVNANQQLQKCEPITVIASAAIAASLDLPINAQLGFSYIVPYGNVAQFQMGWKGFVQLGMRSGQYKTMNATTVLEGQLKRINRFTGEMEFQDEATSDKVVGYLFYFKMLNGYEKYVYMTREECEAHRDRYSAMYRNTKKGPWKDDFDAMALKTVVKRGLGRWGTLSISMERALEYDGAAANTIDLDNAKIEYPDNPPPGIEPGTKKAPTKSRVVAAVEAKTQTEAPPPPQEPEREPGADEEVYL